MTVANSPIQLFIFGIFEHKWGTRKHIDDLNKYSWCIPVQKEIKPIIWGAAITPEPWNRQQCWFIFEDPNVRVARLLRPRDNNVLVANCLCAHERDNFLCLICHLYILLMTSIKCWWRHNNQTTVARIMISNSLYVILFPAMLTTGRVRNKQTTIKLLVHSQTSAMQLLRFEMDFIPHFIVHGITYPC